MATDRYGRVSASPPVLRQCAGLACESAQFLAMLKPLLKKADRLTLSEQQVFENLINQASRALHDAQSLLWESFEAARNKELAVKKG